MFIFLFVLANCAVQYYIIGQNRSYGYPHLTEIPPKLNFIRVNKGHADHILGMQISFSLSEFPVSWAV